VPEIDEEVTSGQIAELLGVSRARVHQLSERPDFPAPTRRVRNYRLWAQPAIEEWAKSWDRTNTGGRPRKPITP